MVGHLKVLVRNPLSTAWVPLASGGESPPSDRSEKSGLTRRVRTAGLQLGERHAFLLPRDLVSGSGICFVCLECDRLVCWFVDCVMCGVG